MPLADVLGGVTRAVLGEVLSDSGAPFTVSLTGLTNSEAIIGDHASISYTTDPVSATETVKWSNSANPADAATYGTGANPTDFTAGDEGRLYLHVTDGGATVTASAIIRYARGTAPAIADGQVFVVGESANIDGSASGANLTFTYSLTAVPAAVSTNASTGLITGAIFSLGAGGTGTQVAVDQYGLEYTDTFTWTREAAPVISGVPTISGTETEGQTLTATAASVTGLPTPSTTWQWERSGVEISGATSATYTLVADDVGETLTVVQTETNTHGSDTAESAATGTIASSASAGFTVNGFTAPYGLLFADAEYRANGASSTLANALTHTRASTATYVDSSGALQTAASGELRVGHHVWDGSAWVNKGALVEEQATNLQADSVNPARGQTVGVTYAASLTTDPADGTNSYRILSDGTQSTAFLRFNQSVTYVSGQTYCFSIYVKPVAGQRYVRVGHGFQIFPDAGRFAAFDLVAGTVTDEQIGVTGYIEKAGNGFWRLSVVATADASGMENNDYYVVLTNVPLFSDSDPTVIPDTDGVDIYGHQYVVGDTPSSYIPTSGSQITRAADARETDKAPYNATGMSGLLDSELRYADTGSATEQTLFDWRADANNRITVTLDTSGANTGKVTLTLVSGGTTASTTTTANLTPGLAVSAKVAWRVTATEVQIALNGTAETAVTHAAGVPDLSAANAEWGNVGTTEKDLLWGADIGSAGLTEATS